MDPLLRTALWQQFGATIDMLENALEACPTSLWQERLCGNSPRSSSPTGLCGVLVYSVSYALLARLLSLRLWKGRGIRSPRSLYPGRVSMPPDYPNGLIGRRNYTPISRRRARSATPRFPR